MTFNPALLHYFIEDALKDYSENFQMLDTKNPVKFSLNGKKYAAHVSYIHDSGENRPNEDEARIQLQHTIVERQRENEIAGFIPAFIGFFEGGKIFTAWEPAYVFARNIETVGTVYARKSHPEVVASKGAAIYRFRSPTLGRESSTVSLPASVMGVYLENIDDFHEVEKEDELAEFLGNVPEMDALNKGRGQEERELSISVDGKREKRLIVSRRYAYPRSEKFKKDVLAAYGGACAICRKQLGIVEAAHIVPHCDDACEDSVNNGIALCVEHHALYDDSKLLMPAADKKLYFNESRAEFLKEIGQANGLDEVKKRAENEYTVPEDNKLHPNSAFLELGIKIRLGQAH